MQTPRQIVQVLRETLDQVELNAKFRPNDPDLLEWKRIILLKINEMEEINKTVRIMDKDMPLVS